MKVVNVLEASRDLDRLLAEKVLNFSRKLDSEMGWGLRDEEHATFYADSRDSLPWFSSSMEDAVLVLRFIRNDIFSRRFRFKKAIKGLVTWDLFNKEFPQIDDSEVLLEVEPVHIAIAALVAYEVVSFQGVV